MPQFLKPSLPLIETLLIGSRGRLIFYICRKNGQKPRKNLCILQVAKSITVFKIICYLIFLASMQMLLDFSSNLSIFINFNRFNF